MTRPRAIPEPVLSRLRCPSCQARVLEEPGAVVCTQGHRMSWRDGWLDARTGAATDDETARTFESFGYEWNTFDQVNPESFGFISSLGVLHHLPDPEAGFRSLVELLAPDGLFLSIYTAALRDAACARPGWRPLRHFGG